jgi:hypothetical protein
LDTEPTTCGVETATADCTEQFVAFGLNSSDVEYCSMTVEYDSCTNVTTCNVSASVFGLTYDGDCEGIEAYYTAALDTEPTTCGVETTSADCTAQFVAFGLNSTDVEYCSMTIDYDSCTNVTTCNVSASVFGLTYDGDCEGIEAYYTAALDTEPTTCGVETATADCTE